MTEKKLSVLYTNVVLRKKKKNLIICDSTSPYHKKEQSFLLSLLVRSHYAFKPQAFLL